MSWIIFLGKTSYWSFWAKRSLKWTQNEVFQVLWKIDAWNFFDFLPELTATQSLKIDLNCFFFFFFFYFGKSGFKFFCPEGAQMGPKWGLPSFIKKLSLRILSLHKVIVLKWFKIDLIEFLWEKPCFDIFVPIVAWNDPKMSFTRYYQKSMHRTFLTFYMKLEWHEDLKGVKWVFGKIFSLS